MNRVADDIRRWRRPLMVVGVAVAVTLSGCTTWRQAYPGTLASAENVVRVQEPAEIRVLLPGGEEVRLFDPAVVGDSIVGDLDHSTVGYRAVSLDDVLRLYVRDVDERRTTAVGVLISIGAFLLFVPKT
jgi:hypothetical protein